MCQPMDFLRVNLYEIRDLEEQEKNRGYVGIKCSIYRLRNE